MTLYSENSLKYQSLVIDFDCSIYSAKAIKRAVHEISNLASVELKSKDRVISAIVLINNKYIPDYDEFARKFKDLVSDHQIRLDVEEDYHIIRQIIVAQAFQPCDNLNEVIDMLKNEKKI